MKILKKRKKTKIQKGNKNILYTKCKITDIKNEDIYSLIYK